MEIQSSQKKPAPSAIEGAGLGLRRSLMKELLAEEPAQVSFYEVAPENWINVGGRYGKQFRQLTERTPLICHGLSLSLGSPAPLDYSFLQQLKEFMAEHNVALYSEHLSYCSDHGHLYDLMPIPFTDEAITYVADRIKQVQDFLGQRIAIENVSYYAAPGKHMEELAFINAVLDTADCDLLLDVNNIFVNSINHGYSAAEFMRALPAERVRYFHMAGHYVEAEDLRIDTHGAPVSDPVFELLAKAYDHFGPVPTLLERDFNIPPLAELLAEVDQIARLQNASQRTGTRQVV